jgi:diaminopimelate decarboxylase
MQIGGINAEDLAHEFGTPALILDFDTFERDLQQILTAALRVGVHVSYAAKALFLVGIAQRLRARPIGIDVSSLGELVTAERGGIAASRITMHGAGKTNDEIEAAFAGRVHRLVADSLYEVERLIAASRGRKLDVLLRINTGIEAHTHEFVRTAGDDSKFGLAPGDIHMTLERLRETPNLKLRGIHSHIGSQIADGEPFVANAEALAETLAIVRNVGFDHADTLVVGGGFGVDPGIDIERALAAIAKALPANTRAEIEPGRAIVARAGTSLYRVCSIKRYDQRTFVIVDGSMADNPRPALYDAHHDVVPCKPWTAPTHRVTIAGRSCENDELATAVLPTDLAPGDLLAMQTTGAYTYSMASNYNRFPKPPVIGVQNGKTFPLARRQTIDDILSCDLKL